MAGAINTQNMRGSIWHRWETPLPLRTTPIPSRNPMADLSYIERRKLERLLRMGSGYVLDFSDRTFSEFFEEHTRRDIDAAVYRERGASKGISSPLLAEITFIGATDSRYDPELRSHGDRSHMIALTPHLDNAVVGHGLERPREIARFATSRLGQRCNGLRVRVLDYQPSLTRKIIRLGAHKRQFDRLRSAAQFRQKPLLLFCPQGRGPKSPCQVHRRYHSVL